MRLKLGKKQLTKALFSEFAPDFVAGGLQSLIGERTTAEIQGFLGKTDSLWDVIPEKQRQMFIAYAPDDMDWLTLSWAVSRISEKRADVGSMILGSPSLQESLTAQLDTIKANLGH